ncbi:hypothetical protein [Gloeocapsopsis sp. IPPAS B-1203]|uniref:hypothetical protein n=1 Tax=Gloeocapsopsis sp. IPPAS B-1203 TaxID=2049454 RepID=UPI000C179C5F|nr:hypothetical protein [Gloeocapsopsis sp. IPPAS B-1203]PIG93715.1 hypothetical protein CSQ79_08785 [Gloeocapsopsis sp. IPPAS B-1203]
MTRQLGKSQFSVRMLGTHTRNAALSSAVTLTVPANGSGLFLSVESGAINYTINGSTPTTGATGLGFKQVPADGMVRLDLFPGAQVRVIEQAASAVIQYQFFSSF